MAQSPQRSHNEARGNVRSDTRMVKATHQQVLEFIT